LSVCWKNWRQAAQPSPEETWIRSTGPVGLDIGSETAEEIALSIIAEIKAVFSSRNGNSLKYKTTVIHGA
jgi:xanthine/CO dehydrogenase XdhC/CoxF family maturation factor